MKQTTTKNPRLQRRRRVRAKISGTAACPRLSVFRSNTHIYSQLIDDVAGRTIVALDDTKIKAADKDLPAKVALAKAVGRELAKLATDKKITKIVFDRGGYLYTGRVKALAEGAREGGLVF